MLDPMLVKGSWTKEEDMRLVELVHQHGPKEWSSIAEKLPGRVGKQCRERCVLLLIHNYITVYRVEQTNTDILY